MKKLLLLGMGPGNGLAIARRFGRGGFEILMVARSEERLAAFKNELEKEGITSRFYAADLTDSAGFGLVLQRIVAENGPINGLHYNASAFNPARPSEIDLAVFMDDFRTNVVGAIQAIQAVLPSMKLRGEGFIFLTGGGTAIDPPANLASLGIGKAAIRNLAFSLADECHPRGIQVATITICGFVQPGGRFDPDLLAEKWWQLAGLRKEDWPTEVVWK